jgi:hypothetical protein
MENLNLDLYDGTKRFYFAFESHVDKIIQREGLEWVLPTIIPDPSCPAAILRKERLSHSLTLEEHQFLQNYREFKKNSEGDCGKVIAIIRSRLAPHVEARMMSTLEEEDISNREKARKLRREMREVFGRNDLSTRNEIIADMDNLSFGEDIPTANKLIANMIQLNNILRKMGHPRSDEQMRALLFNKLHGPLFERVLSNLNTGRDGITFSIACEQLQRVFSSQLAKENHRRRFAHLSSSGAAEVKCFNCGDQHLVRDCPALYCDHCKGSWNSINDYGYHHFSKCSSQPNQRRVVRPKFHHHHHEYLKVDNQSPVVAESVTSSTNNLLRL